MKRICGCNSWPRWKRIYCVRCSSEATIIIYPAWEAQIALVVVKIINIPVEYLDFEDIFLKKLAAELSKGSNIHKYFIDLKPGKQPLYESIYNLEPVELKTWKTYIKTNLSNNFICLSKSPTKTLILFIKMPDTNFGLCVDY